MIRIEDAIISLCGPNACFALYDDKLEWLDNKIPRPSDEQIQEEIKRLGEVEAANQYRVDRQKSYPSLGDQLDMLWHSMNSDEIPKCAQFYDAIKDVKDKNPKP